MKKAIYIILFASMIALCSGCGSGGASIEHQQSEEVIYGHFIVVQEEKLNGEYCYTAYDNNTGVLYYIVGGGCGYNEKLAITPLYDCYGNICTYDSDEH